MLLIIELSSGTLRKQQGKESLGRLPQRDGCSFLLICILQLHGGPEAEEVKGTEGEKRRGQDPTPQGRKGSSAEGAGAEATASLTLFSSLSSRKADLQWGGCLLLVWSVRAVAGSGGASFSVLALIFPLLGVCDSPQERRVSRQGGRQSQGENYRVGI